MNYQEFINNILHTRGRFACGDKYHEKHHIIPRCKNGSNNEENLIDLFAREHFIAHKLLYEENPNDSQLAHAYTLMAFIVDKNQQRYELTPDEYEEVRKVYADRFSGGKCPSAKRVIRLLDEKQYETVKACCIDNDISYPTMNSRCKNYREFAYYDEWINMTDDERERIKSIDWDAIEHAKRSQAAKTAGNGGSVKCSEETRNKIKKAHIDKNGKCVYCPQLNETFDSIGSVCRKYGFNHTSIGYCLCGKQKHAGKHPVTGEKLLWVQLENKIS